MIHPHFDTEPTAPLTDADAYRTRLQDSLNAFAAQDKANADVPTVRPGLHPSVITMVCTLAMLAAIFYAGLFFGWYCGNWWITVLAIVFVGAIGWAAMQDERGYFNDKEN